MTRAALETAVVAAMENASMQPMRWGTDDCACWSANVLRSALDYDAAADWRGRYSTRRGAMRLIGRGGLLSALRKMARRHEWQKINPELAQPGDVGLMWTAYNGKPVLATVVCRSRGWFVGRSDFGFAAFRASKVSHAWSVLYDALPAGPGPRVNLSRMQMGSNLRSAEVTQDPISIFVLTAVGIEATATAVAITTFAITAAVSVGISLVSSLLQPHTGQTLSDNSISQTTAQGAQITERQPIPFKRVIVGKAYVGGALFYEQVQPPYLIMGILINHGKITGIDNVYIGANKLSFSQFTADAILTPIAVDGQPNYPARLQVSLRYGDDDQAADLIILNNRITAIAGGTGTPIGDMTANGGLAAAFDGNVSKTKAQSAAASGLAFGVHQIGKDWGSGNTKTISYFVFNIPTDYDGGPIAVTFEGSTDNFATSTTLFSLESTNYVPGQSKAVQEGIDVSTAYRYHRLTFQTFRAAIAQVTFYEQASASEMTQFRQRGIATAVYRYHFGVNQDEFTALWGQVQRPTAFTVVRGVAVYDPRDPTQNRDDELTWKWSNNATLIQAWYLTRSFGGRIPMSRIRWDKIATSADYDDSLIGCNDGTTIARHTIDGVIALNQEPFQVIQQLLAANRAMLLESGGQIWIQSSYPKASIATIHDRILAGGLNYQAGKQKSDLVNKLQVRFVYPDEDYQTVDGPILSRTDLQAIDQEVLPATLALNYTQDHRRAQRLQKCFLESARLGRTVTCNIDLRLMATAADELIGSVVTVDSVLFSKANGNYMVTAVGFSDDCTTLSLSLAEYDPTIETNWNPEVDEQPFTLANVS